MSKVPAGSRIVLKDNETLLDYLKARIANPKALPKPTLDEILSYPAYDVANFSKRDLIKAFRHAYVPLKANWEAAEAWEAKLRSTRSVVESTETDPEPEKWPLEDRLKLYKVRMEKWENASDEQLDQMPIDATQVKKLLPLIMQDREKIVKQRDELMREVKTP